jgi:hypothetical protein
MLTRDIFSPPCAQILDQPLRVIGFIATHGYALIASDPLCHLRSRFALGRIAADHHLGVYRQAVTILNQHIAAVG